MPLPSCYFRFHFHCQWNRIFPQPSLRVYQCCMFMVMKYGYPRQLSYCKLQYVLYANTNFHDNDNTVVAANTYGTLEKHTHTHTRTHTLTHTHTHTLHGHFCVTACTDSTMYLQYYSMKHKLCHKADITSSGRNFTWMYEICMRQYKETDGHRGHNLVLSTAAIII